LSLALAAPAVGGYRFGKETFLSLIPANVPEVRRQGSLRVVFPRQSYKGHNDAVKPCRCRLETSRKEGKEFLFPI
jgi:hypothetical protein